MTKAKHDGRARTIRTGLLAALLVLGAGPAPAQEFLRGDTNGDGATTFSDAHYLLNFLFRGGPALECFSASDVDDDGTIDITDPVRLLNHRVLGGAPPCTPYPDPGKDTTGVDLGCHNYGAGEPLDDASAAIEIRAVGGSPGKAVLTLAVSSSRSMAGYEAVVSAEGGVFANASSAKVRDLSGTLKGGFAGARVVGGKLRIGFLSSLTEPTEISAGPLRDVLEMEVCLTEGTASGSYALTVESGELADNETGRSVPARLQGATLVLGGGVPAGAGCVSGADPSPPQLECGTGPGPDPDPDPDPDPGPEPGPEPGISVDFTRGDINTDGRRSISDPVMLERFLFFGDRAPPCMDAADANDSGRIDITDTVYLLNHLFLGGADIPAPAAPIGPDPTPDAVGCETFDVEPADETDEVVRLGAVTAAPGSETSIPVYLTNEVPIEAFQLVISYDPSVFTPGPPDRRFVRVVFDGTFYEGRELSAFNAVTAHEEEGILTVAFIPHLTDPGFAVPPGTDRLVFKIPGTISSTAQPGTEVFLEPTNGPGGVGFGPERLLNELTHTGTARYLSTLPELEGAILGIVGDQTFFVRGDSNGDATLDIGDATHTLGGLFLAAPSLACPDAADANDDGTLDITDPIFGLNHLFQGGVAPPAPFPAAGEDPTSDALGCSRGSAAP